MSHCLTQTHNLFPMDTLHDTLSHTDTQPVFNGHPTWHTVSPRHITCHQWAPNMAHCLTQTHNLSSMDTLHDTLSDTDTQPVFKAHPTCHTVSHRHTTCLQYTPYMAHCLTQTHNLSSMYTLHGPLSHTDTQPVFNVHPTWPTVSYRHTTCLQCTPYISHCLTQTRNLSSMDTLHDTLSDTDTQPAFNVHPT